MRLFKRITALALAAVTAGALGLSAAAEVEETAAEPIELEVYCPTNEDPEFPFCLDIDVMPGSIQYIDLDEPVYGFERVLDEEALDFDVSFSLKDEYKSFDSYTFKVFSADYSEEIVSEQNEVDETISVSGLSLATGYKISMTLESESLNAYYGGSFIIQAELDSTLAVDLFYQFAGMDGDAAPFANERTEDDTRNNKKETADLLNYLTMTAYTVSGDKDYFWHPVPGRIADDGETVIEEGVDNLTFTIKADGKDITGLTVRIFLNDENYPIKLVTKDKLSNGETLTIVIPNIHLDEHVYIKITSTSATSAKYNLHVSDNFGEAWFSQYVSKIGDIEYWNANKLDKLKCSGQSIFVEGSEDKDISWFAESCGIVASAMILRSKNAKMNGYDFRTEYRGDLMADPFTAMLASCNTDGTSMNADSTIFLNSAYPSILYSPYIANKFKMSLEYISETSVSLKNIDSSYENQLRVAINRYGYVLIYFNYKDSCQHFMVLTGLEYGTADFAKRALVLDPAAKTYAMGAGVNGEGIKLSETGWYKKNQSVAKLSNSRVYY